jgi:hypothetical protein
MITWSFEVTECRLSTVFLGPTVFTVVDSTFTRNHSDGRESSNFQEGLLGGSWMLDLVETDQFLNGVCVC